MKTPQAPTVGDVVERSTASAASIDPQRRLWITATTVVGGTGLVASAVPFVPSLAPSERARALGSPVAVELQAILPGEVKVVEWRGKPVFVLTRSQDMLDALVPHNDLLADTLSRRSIQPAPTRNAMRSLKPGLVVLEAVCTHLWCIPTFRPTPGAPDIGASWPGGSYCPCHGSKFDFAGRVFKNVPAPTNLTVPPHQLVSESKLLIGIDAEA
jgi:ubiquinol-cytochrome c reductase iron-sulfur subunit